MNTCKTCTHWILKNEEKDDEVIVMHDENYKSLPNADPECRYCRSPKLLFYVRPNGTQAAVVDGSQYKANLVTTEHFGCINHEKLI